MRGDWAGSPDLPDLPDLPDWFGNLALEVQRGRLADPEHFRDKPMMFMDHGIEMETIFGDGSQQTSGILGSLLGSVMFHGIAADAVTEVRLDAVAQMAIAHFIAFGAIGTAMSFLVHRVQLHSQNPILVLVVFFGYGTLQLARVPR